MAGGNYQQIDNRKIDAETIVIPLICGFLYGFATLKALVYLPSVIFGQLQWTIFLFIKFYLAAIIASLVAGVVMSLIGGETKNRFEESRTRASRGFLSIVLGSVLIGFGMVMSGAEPGLAFVQAGSGVWSGYYVICGGLLAVVAYGFLHKEVISKIDEQGRPNNSTFDGVFKCEYWHVALPLALMFAAVAYFLEIKWAKKWSSEIPSGTTANNSWLPQVADQAWNPYYVGALCGLMQIPFRASLFCMLDSTYAFIATVCVPLKVLADKLNWTLPAWFNDHSSTGGLWSLIFFGAAAGGALLSASLGGMLSFEKGYSLAWSMGGGFLLVFGSLVAGMCPTGMAMSGISDLNMSSYIGTAVLLLVGFGTAMLFKHENIHPESSSSFLMSAVYSQ